VLTDEQLAALLNAVPSFEPVWAEGTISMKHRAIGSDRLMWTPYVDLDTLLVDLVHRVRIALRDTFVGAYLQGSFATGDFDRDSDVDFIIVTRDELTGDQVAVLQAMHERIFDLPSSWAKHLEGSYIAAEVLRDFRRRGTPLWYLDHGSRTLVRSEHCNTLVVRSVLREGGVVLAGPRPATLIDVVPVDMLREEMRDVIRGWGQEILANPDRYRNRFYQGHLVLNFARMLHDLVEGRPGSKLAGATWAKATLDPAWSALIDRAWGGRPDPATAVREPADSADFERTLEFVRTIMSESERVP
jgi:predicted nucleotidyltransferase